MISRKKIIHNKTCVQTNKLTVVLEHLFHNCSPSQICIVAFGDGFQISNLFENVYQDFCWMKFHFHKSNYRCKLSKLVWTERRQVKPNIHLHVCEFCIKHFDWLTDIWERTHNCLLYFKFSRLSKLLFRNRFFPLISNPKIQMKKDRRPCHKCTLRCNPYSCVATPARWEVLIMFYLTEQRNLLTKGLSGPFNYALPKIRYYWQFVK